ncbi:MAG: ATP-binding cassette domain-containing protein [Streptosporangiaceae bacterium]
MTQYGTWVSYGGDARIWLAIGLLAVAGGVTLAGIRLPLPVRATRPGPVGRIAMILAWVASIAAFLVCVTIYARQYVHAYGPEATAPPTDRIAPITLLAVAVVFVIIISRRSPGFRTRLASGAICAIAAPMIFELPFDLIVMARTYPPIPPDPALYRALFFVPLFLIEITTLLLLRLSPMVRLTRATFFSFALMLGVFAVWALSGFGYPSAPLPTALNIASKILAFVTALTLFLPQRPAPEQAPQPDSNEQAQPARPPLALDSPALTEIADDPQLTGQPAGSIVDEQAKPVPLSPGHHPSPAAVPQLAKVKEADMSEPAVVVRGLCKSFGAKEAVAGIDLEIAAGSLAGLVGPNGAGKTTSLSMMTGLLRPDVGQILINGLDVWADGPRAAKAAIGVVPDQARLFERLSGAEMLEYAGRLRGMPAAEARSRATQLLDVLDLTADAKRLVADYSTGMRKKVMLGCALIHNPSVLFLDEPLEGVDPVSADVIRRLLTRFTASGSTVLFSSHVMELVEQVCDHVSIIDKGRIVATGTTEQVRGGKTLQRAFLDLVGPHARDEEGLSWLGASSS